MKVRLTKETEILPGLKKRKGTILTVSEVKGKGMIKTGVAEDPQKPEKPKSKPTEVKNG